MAINPSTVLSSDSSPPAKLKASVYVANLQPLEVSDIHSKRRSRFCKDTRFRSIARDCLQPRLLQSRRRLYRAARPDGGFVLRERSLYQSFCILSLPEFE